ncbi:MAG: N-acetylmuramoyl-L-alanine amidase family protein, partial [Endomicrobiales bacterium]
PGKEASFTVERVKGAFPLVEAAQAPGTYRGVYTAGANDKLNKSKIRVTLADKKNRKKITGESRRTLSLFKHDAPVVAEISAERAILRSGPGLSPVDRGAYMLFLPRGTNLRVTGRRGDELRVGLTGTRDAWITQGDVKILPPGTPPARAAAENIRVTGRERTTEVRLPLGKRVPFEVVPDDEGKYIDVTIFGAVSNTDMVVYTSTGGVEQVRWFQDTSDTYRLRVRPYPGRWWGYDARYEGSAFVLELRSPPVVLRGTAPLSGITIAVDPGHSPDTGAIGPTGLVEKDANLALALCLREKLKSRGAKVVLTRNGSDGAALYDRSKTAYRANADILISVHNNALSYGQNPFEKNGYSVYYYHPASLPLAREIHAAYGELLGQGGAPETALRDDGLYYNNLAIPRTTQMPTVLTESAYIIIPREEACLRSPAFQEKCADAITKGVERYVGAVCRREAPPPKAKKKTLKSKKKM